MGTRMMLLIMLALLTACSSGGGAAAPAMTSSAASPSPNPNATFTPLPAPQGAAFQLASFTLSGGPQAIIPPGMPGLQYTPDEHMTFLRQPDGTFRLWVAGGGTYGTYLFTTSDFVTLGTPTMVFGPSGTGTTAFDADYAGAGSVFPASDGTALLMIYHAENHLFNGVDSPGTPFYAGIGLARSSDNGMTWQREGEIISGHDPQQPTQTGGAGALTPSAIEVGGFIYVVFREIDQQSDVSGYAVARAPIASDGAPGTWEKYDNGAFSTPGLGGSFTPLNITLDPAVPGDQRQPDISFNTSLNAFLMTTVGNGGIYALTSSDLITWSASTLVFPAPTPDAAAGTSGGPRNWYPTLISPSEPADQLTAATGYLYYANFPGNGTADHSLDRQAYTITASAMAASAKRRH